MFLKLRPLLCSLVFLLGLEFIALKQEAVLAVTSSLFIISLLEGKKIGGKWFFSILPIFFTLSSTALLYLITLIYEQQIFIALASAMYYLSLLGAYRLGKYGGDQTARGMNMAAASVTIFFTYASAYGLYLNFLVPIYVLMLVYLLVTLFISYQHFSIIKNDQKKLVWAYSFLLALAMVELIWTMNFWPFGYLTTGTVALILYYVLWDMIQGYFLNLLSKKRVVANAVFFSVLILMILASSKWIPVI
jgi:hypothetical protein